MEAAAAAGVHIPHFCWHKKLSIAANCRMCLVEVAKSPKPLPACATPVVDGMVVRTDSPAAKKAQQGVMEFLLINHPLDCPICDQGGECELQDLAVGYGISRSRYAEEKRVVFEKQLGPLISTDMTRCIHCTRCVRFGREVAGVMELGLTGRGEHAEIMPFVENTVDSELSGNMIDVCPVGALTSKPFRFSARPWELQTKPGISAHDSWGSNLELHCKGPTVMRVVPRENEEINECWISDRDRFSYLALDAPDRGKSPMRREESSHRLSESPWATALDSFAETIRALSGKYGADKIGFLASPNATTEELFLLQKIARGVGCENIDHRLRRRDFSGGEINGYGITVEQMRRREHLLLVGAQPSAELPLLAHLLRRRPRRLALSSVGAAECGAAGNHILARPSQWSGILESVLRAAQSGGGEKNETAAAAGKKLAGKETSILFGGGAVQSPHYPALLEIARAMSREFGATLGVLCGGANGGGAAKTGAMPRAGGMNTAEMLRGGLRAFVLFQCEPEDFAERALLSRALGEAEYVAAIGAHSGGLRDCARLFLPAAAAAETEGTFINGEGRAQTFAAAARPPGLAREGWKILRVLGEKLGLDGFDFSTFAEIRPQFVGEDFYNGGGDGAAAVSKKKNGADDSGGLELDFAPANNGLELAFAPAIYDADMLTRRSPALQKTASGKNAALAQMHPEDLRALGAEDGDWIRFSDSEGGAMEAAAKANPALARGVLLARCGGLFGAENITAEKMQMDKAASG